MLGLTGRPYSTVKFASNASRLPRSLLNLATSLASFSRRAFYPPEATVSLSYRFAIFADHPQSSCLVFAHVLGIALHVSSYRCTIASDCHKQHVCQISPHRFWRSPHPCCISRRNFTHFEPPSESLDWARFSGFLTDQSLSSTDNRSKLAEADCIS